MIAPLRRIEALSLVIAPDRDFWLAKVKPAVTLGLLVGRQITVTRAVVYWIAQFAGGLVAALVLRFIFPAATNLGQTVPAAGISGGQAMVILGNLTFFLGGPGFLWAVYGKVRETRRTWFSFSL